MFDLDCTIVDTHYALIWALEYARELGLPLHGFAMCYGAIPLLAQFKRGGYGRFMRSVSTISGLYHLNQILRVEDFAPIVSRHIGREIDAPSLLEEIAGGVLDCDGLGFKQALQEYLSKLMPDLRVELDYFEELKYERVNKRQALLQFCQSDYLDGVEVPPWMPCTAYIGHQDELLYAGGPADPESYKDYVLSVVPHASVLEFEMDHYGRGPDRDTVVQCVGDAFERFDTSPVPPRHVDNFTHQQAVLR